MRSEETPLTNTNVRRGASGPLHSHAAKQGRLIWLPTPYPQTLCTCHNLADTRHDAVASSYRPTCCSLGRAVLLRLLGRVAVLHCRPTLGPAQQPLLGGPGVALQPLQPSEINGIPHHLHTEHTDDAEGPRPSEHNTEKSHRLVASAAPAARPEGRPSASTSSREGR